MMNKLTGWDDTIVALATPPGVGAIGVIRLSGSKAITRNKGDKRRSKKNEVIRSNNRFNIDQAFFNSTSSTDFSTAFTTISICSSFKS